MVSFPRGSGIRAERLEKGRQESYELLAAHFSQHLDLDKVNEIIDQQPFS